MSAWVCPDWPQTEEPAAGDVPIIGCGAVFDAEPDFEGNVDCPSCGIWFDPTHPNNQVPTAQ